MPDRMTPLQATDDDARQLAAELIGTARSAALGTLDPENGHPLVTRVALGTGPEGGIWVLVSGLAAHARALENDPRAALLLGETPGRGDPLVHPRLSLQVMAEPLPPADPMHPSLRDRWLADHPKSKLYIDLPDFRFIHLRPVVGFLNGGFGRAWHLMPEDLPKPGITGRPLVPPPETVPETPPETLAETTPETAGSPPSPAR